jgi:ppGpp synthetase/RelA/SpoT-type nucleotidyltranferase
MQIDKLLNEFSEKRALYEEFAARLVEDLEVLLNEGRVHVHVISSRVKEPKKLGEKLGKTGDDGKAKYECLTDITDLAGCRIITYYLDDVERVSRLIRENYEIDWIHSEDKAHLLRAEEFGYLSDHYVVAFKDSVARMRFFKKFKDLRAEIQVRSILQHAWAEIEHGDLGYGTAGHVPRDVRRGLARVAGLLEVADREFQSIRELSKKLKTKGMPQIRAEGLAEAIPEFEICVPRNIVPTTGGDLAIYFNLNLAASSGSAQNLYLVVEDGTASRLIRGSSIAPNGAIFSGALPRSIPKSLRQCRFRIGGVRVNAKMLTANSIVSCWLAGKTDGGTVEAFASFEDVARIEQGLIARASIDDSALRLAISQCDFGVHHVGKIHTIAQVGPVVRLQLREGFPNAFRQRDHETASDRESHSTGTRFIVQIWGLEPLQEIWVSTREARSNHELQPTSMHRQLTCRLVTGADSNGASGSLDAESRYSVKVPGSDGIQLERIMTNAGSSVAVWEVTASPGSETSRLIELLVVPVQLSDGKSPYQPIRANLTVSFAPLSTNGGASKQASTPRFVPSAGPTFTWGS